MWEFLNYSRAVGLKLFECQINWRVDKTDYWALPSRVLNSVCLGWGLTICISDNFPGDTWCSWSREPHSENHCIREPWMLRVLQFSSVQWLSRVWLFASPWTAARQASLSITNSWSPPKLISTESMMPSNNLILCCPLLLLPSIFPASRSFPVTHLFASGDPSIRASALASVLPMNIQSWFPLGSSCSPRDSQKSSPAPQFESINFFRAQPSLWSNFHIYTRLLEKP